jgi:hypothetical protein
MVVNTVLNVFMKEFVQPKISLKSREFFLWKEKEGWLGRSTGRHI